MSGTHIAYGASALRACYAMSDVRYSHSEDCYAMCHTGTGRAKGAMRCPVLRWRMGVSAYAHATQCPGRGVQAQGGGASGTGIAYAAIGLRCLPTLCAYHSSACPICRPDSLHSLPLPLAHALLHPELKYKKPQFQYDSHQDFGASRYACAIYLCDMPMLCIYALCLCYVSMRYAYAIYLCAMPMTVLAILLTQPRCCTENSTFRYYPVPRLYRATVLTYALVCTRASLPSALWTES
eukprot:3056099-Rhodomonas_salina.2